VTSRYEERRRASFQSKVEEAAMVRVLDATAAVTVPLGFVPSAKTLGEDLTKRLRRLVSRKTSWSEAELTQTGHRAAVMTLTEWVLVGKVKVEIVREAHGDKLVGVVVSINVEAGNG
jgi:hypothetical protein